MVHPATLFGLLFGAVFVVVTTSEVSRNGPIADQLGLPLAAISVGVFPMIAAHQLARSWDRADELVRATPTDGTTRSGAMCLAAIGPVAGGVAWLVLYPALLIRVAPPPDWFYGSLSRADILVVVVGHTVVAAAGGALLGVASGRWLRFRGAAVAVFVGVVLWVFLSMGAFSTGGAAPEWQRWTRLFSPLSVFTVAQINPTAIDSLTGSPWWYLGWLVTLCALAAVAALLKSAQRARRRRLIRVGVSILLVSAVTYALASAGGLEHAVRTYPDGRSVVLVP